MLCVDYIQTINLYVGLGHPLIPVDAVGWSTGVRLPVIFDLRIVSSCGFRDDLFML